MKYADATALFCKLNRIHQKRFISAQPVSHRCLQSGQVWSIVLTPDCHCYSQSALLKAADCTTSLTVTPT